MPQSRAARSWDDERKGMKMKTGGISGGAEEEGRADAVRRGAVRRHELVEDWFGSLSARAAQRRAKHPARSAAKAVVADGVRLPSRFPKTTARRAVSTARPWSPSRPGARRRGSTGPHRPPAPERGGPLLRPSGPTPIRLSVGRRPDERKGTSDPAP